MAQNANLEKNNNVAIDVAHHDDNDLESIVALLLTWSDDKYHQLILIRRAIGTWMCMG